MRALILAVVVLAAGCGKAKTTEALVDELKHSAVPSTVPNAVPNKPDRLKPSINAGQLWLEYGDNQAKADEDYTGRRITVGGDVHSVVKHGDGYEVRFTVLATEGPGNSQPGAVARFAASESGKVAKLKSLEMCYLQGRCKGRVESGPRGYTVVIEECTIISEPKF